MLDKLIHFQSLEGFIMKKNGLLLRIGVAAMVLTLASTSLMSGTLAKYFSESTGTAAAIIAKWNPQAKINDQIANEWTVNLASTQTRATPGSSNSQVASNRIAPGMKGAFPIEVSSNGSEVAIDYKVEISIPDGYKPSLLTDNVVFKVYDEPNYSEGGGKTISVNARPTELCSGTLGVSGSEKVTKYVYWEWPYETTSGGVSDNDEEDTNAGKEAASATSEGEQTQNIAVTITMTQKDGTVSQGS